MVGQTAALKLGIDVAKVKVELGNSTLPPAPVAGGSITTASVCNAFALPCDKIRERLVTGKNEQGGHLMKEGRLVAADGASEELRRSSASAPRRLRNMPSSYRTDRSLAPWARSTRAARRSSAEPETRTASCSPSARSSSRCTCIPHQEVRVPRVVGAFAAGHIVNPRTTHSQLMGGMVWGLSSGLHEATEIDPRDARYVNDNLADYFLPVNADIGTVDVVLVPEVDKEVNPLGIKGVGELGIVGTAAALTNAVYNATGVRTRDLPVRIEKLLV